MLLRHLIPRTILLLALAVPLRLQAEIYVYVDDQGLKHYTNTPTNSRYRPVSLPRLNSPQPGTSSERGSRPQRHARRVNPAQFDRIIEKSARANSIDPLLIKAIIKVESDFDQFATSVKGAQGLMQLMPETAREMRVSNSYSSSQNISGGTRYLRKLLNTYDGDLARSLAAYNAGPGRVAKKGPLPRIKETQEYVRKVINHYRRYQQVASDGQSAQASPQLITLN